MEKFKIIWTNQAKAEVKKIYNYYKEKSPQGAKNLRTDLLQSPKTIYFTKQYQVDDINTKYRRIIVRGEYKVLYKVEADIIKVVDVVSVRQSTEILKNK